MSQPAWLCPVLDHRIGPGWEPLTPVLPTLLVPIALPSSLLRSFWESGTSLVAQIEKRLPIMWETWVQSLGQEDLLEKAMATHSSIPAWRFPWMKEPGRLQSMGSQRFGHD